MELASEIVLVASTLDQDHIVFDHVIPWKDVPYGHQSVAGIVLARQGERGGLALL